MGHRITAFVAIFFLAVAAAETQPLMPRCSPSFDGQVSEAGCICRHDSGGQLTGRSAGWRWSCDLLRGPGLLEAVPPAGFPPPSLPRGFAYSPQMESSAMAGAGGRSMGY